MSWRDDDREIRSLLWHARGMPKTTGKSGVIRIKESRNTESVLTPWRATAEREDAAPTCGNLVDPL